MATIRDAMAPTTGVATVDFATQRLRASSTPTAPTDMRFVGASVSDILGLQSDEVEKRAAAEAAGISAQGYQAEVDAYTRAGGIADTNAQIAQVASDIRAYQADAELQRSLGAARAAGAAQGFSDGGAVLDILRSSMQEGYLNQQLIGLEGQIEVSGYHQQSLAYQASAIAADTARQSALASQGAYLSSAEMAAVQAANETAALTSYLQTTQLDKQSKAEYDLITGVLAGTETGAALDDAAREVETAGTSQQTQLRSLTTADAPTPWNPTREYPTPGITGFTQQSYIIDPRIG